VAEAYAVIRGELEQYGHGLAEKAEVLALNKIDSLAPEEVAEKQAVLREASGGAVHALSGVSGAGVREVLFALLPFVQEARAARRASREEGDDGE